MRALSTLKHACNLNRLVYMPQTYLCKTAVWAYYSYYHREVKMKLMIIHFLICFILHREWHFSPASHVHVISESIGMITSGPYERIFLVEHYKARLALKNAVLGKLYNWLEWICGLTAGSDNSLVPEAVKENVGEWSCSLSLKIEACYITATYLHTATSYMCRL